MTKAANLSALGTNTSSAGVLEILSGGTGQTTATAAFNALNPMTTVGDIIYEGTGPAAARLPIGTTGQILTVSSGIPSWATITAFVSGMIMMWSGSAATIPSGWVLCDGANSTPDLRNRFVVGATSTYAVGATGGSADAIVVSHTHTGTTSTIGNHNHNNGNFTQIISTAASTGISFGFGGGRPAANMTDAGSHNHTFTTDSSGSSGTNANLPPYYALCYIMKT